VQQTHGQFGLPSAFELKMASWFVCRVFCSAAHATFCMRLRLESIRAEGPPSSQPGPKGQVANHFMDRGLKARASISVGLDRAFSPLDSIGDATQGFALGWDDGAPSALSVLPMFLRAANSCAERF